MSLKRGEIQAPQKQIMPRRQSRGTTRKTVWENRFKHFGMNEQQAIAVDSIRFRATELAKVIDDNCPENREKSLALTKLEESAMWAIKCITHNPK